MKLKKVSFDTLKGKTITNISINKYREVLTFVTACGKQYLQRHDQTCCEYVNIEDICGSLDDLLNTPILVAEEVINHDEDIPPRSDNVQDTYTWTFYKLDTIKGGVTIRWFGTSSGYYSEIAELFENTDYYGSGLA